MIDMSDTIIAKSDQLNASDLTGAPITITISKVSKVKDPAQPIHIHYEGDNGRPWKPCKGQRVLLTGMWGRDASVYAGRRLTLYRDPTVLWAGKEEGGIRVSHASHIESDFKMPIRLSKAKVATQTVRPIANDVPKTETFDFPTFESAVATALDTPQTHAELTTWWESMKPERLKARSADQNRAAKSATAVAEKLAELENND